MAGQVYFGNQQYQTWIKAPNTGMQAGSAGYVVEQQLLNGRTHINRSRASHRTFSPTWMGSLNANEESLQVIKNFADGLYGDGPFYWLDPFATNTNILPPHWAAPGLAGKDWPTLDQSIIPTFGNMSSVVSGYPLSYAQYDYTTARSSERILYIPIPEGYTFHFGWHSPTAPTTFGGVKVLRFLRDGTAASALTPAGINILTTPETKINASVDGDTYGMVGICTYSVSTSVSVLISAMVGMILPNGVTPSTGSFSPGMGTTALEFSSFPQIDYYSANVNSGQVGMSVNLVEVD